MLYSSKYLGNAGVGKSLFFGPCLPCARGLHQEARSPDLGMELMHTIQIVSMGDPPDATLALFPRI